MDTNPRVLGSRFGCEPQRGGHIALPVARRKAPAAQSLRIPGDLSTESGPEPGAAAALTPEMEKVTGMVLDHALQWGAQMLIVWFVGLS